MKVSRSTSIVICGATSAIAQDIAKLWAMQGARFVLQSRDEKHLSHIREDLLARGASQVDMYTANAQQLLNAGAFTTFVTETLGDVDILLIAFGVLGDQQQDQAQFERQHELFTTNFLAPAALMTAFSSLMEAKQRGCMVVLSSVAGDRGRKANYIYGASKAALSCYASGLRARLSAVGVNVLTLKLGVVQTPMTAHLKPSKLSVKPTEIAPSVVRAVEQNKKIIFAPWYWRPILFIIKAIPEFMFGRFSH